MIDAKIAEKLKEALHNTDTTIIIKYEDFENLLKTAGFTDEFCEEHFKDVSLEKIDIKQYEKQLDQADMNFFQALS